MNEQRTSSRLCWGLCLAVLTAQTLTAALSYVTLLRDATLVRSLPPEPLYGFLPVPQGHGARTSLGADFSQVYYAASALRHGDAPYAPRNPTFRDRLGRRPNYPPFTNHLYVPLTLLPYRDAVVVHSLATLGLFLGLTVLVLGAFGLARHAVAASLASVLLGLLTPVGFSHFERGQFDFVVASSFLLVVASVYLRRASVPAAVAGTCLGALKWTSVPFLALFSLLGLFGSATVRRRVAFWAVPLVFALTLAPFASELREYWPSLRLYELQASPTGVSLQLLLPRVAARAVPVVSTLLVLALFLVRSRRGWDRQRALEAVAVPFALALALQTLCVVTIAYEYRVVSLLGLLPPTLVWLDRAVAVSRGIRNAVALLLGTFLVLSFRVFDRPMGIADPERMLFVYCAWSAMFLAIAIWIAWSFPTASSLDHPSAPDAGTVDG